MQGPHCATRGIGPRNQRKYRWNYEIPRDVEWVDQESGILNSVRWCKDDIIFSLKPRVGTESKGIRAWECQYGDVLGRGIWGENWWCIRSLEEEASKQINFHDC